MVMNAIVHASQKMAAWQGFVCCAFFTDTDCNTHVKATFNIAHRFMCIIVIEAFQELCDFPLNLVSTIQNNHNTAELCAIGRAVYFQNGCG